MKILVAPNSMKGSLSAKRFAETVEKAFTDSYPGFFKIRRVPVADGGDGTVEILIDSLNLKRIPVIINDPLGREIRSSFGYANGIAAIEMADASGMKLLSRDELNPMKTSSYGTGQLILEAAGFGAKRIYLGVGGSATVDGGMGMLEALGVKFFNHERELLSGSGENLTKIFSIDTIDLKITKEVEIKVISDVDNPLLGKNGAAQIFAPQKGATPDMVGQLEDGLCNFEKIIKQKTGKITADIKGSGAAGGVGIGLIAFLNSEIVPGADFILKLLDFRKHLDWADIVITGEGKFDRQSLRDKAPIVVARQANEAGKPVYAIVGLNEFKQQTVFEKIFALVSQDSDVEKAILDVEKLVYDRANKLAGILVRK